MSFTLTNRDTAVLTMSVQSIDKDGVKYFAAETSATERFVGYCRHQGSATGPGTRRANLHLERWLYDATLRKWFPQKVDVTLSEDTGYPWSADQSDDLLTWAFNYFDSEATSGVFANGGAKT